MKRILLALLMLAAVPAHALTYSTWIASHSLTGDDALPASDPDEDGLSNLTEFAFDGLDPTEPNGLNHASLPQAGFARRTGAALGQWEWSATIPTNGLAGVWHYATRYVLRADITGVRITPQLSTSLTRWYGGRGAVRVTTISGTTKMAVAITKGNRHSRMFSRIRVTQIP